MNALPQIPQAQPLVLQLSSDGSNGVNLAVNQQGADEVVMLQMLAAATNAILGNLAAKRAAKPGLVIARPLS